MGENEAMSLLERAVGRQELVGDSATATELLEELDFLPLVITQAAAYMNAKRVPSSQYLHLLRNTEQDAVYILSTEIRDGTRYKRVLWPKRGLYRFSKSSSKTPMQPICCDTYHALSGRGFQSRFCLV